MNKILRKASIILAITIFSLITILFSISFLYGDKITKILIQQISKNLNTEITVSKTDFWLIRYFPSATLTLYDLRIKPSKEFLKYSTEESDILVAKELTVKFNILKLLSKSYIINGIKVEDAVFNYILNKKGYSNYNFWNSSDSSKTDYNLRHIQFNRCTYNYTDTRTDEKIHFYIEETAITGVISSLQRHFSLKIKNLNSTNTYFSDNFKTIKSIKLKYNFNKNSHIINNGIVIIDNCLLEFSSEIKNERYIVLFKMDDFQLDVLKNITNPKFLKSIKGTCKAVGEVTGHINDPNYTKLKVDINLNRVDLELGKFEKIKNINGKVSLMYTFKDKGIDLSSDALNFSILNSTITGKIDYKLKTFQEINLSLESDILATDLNEYSKESGFAFHDGNIILSLSIHSKKGITREDTLQLSDFILNLKANLKDLSLSNKEKKIEVSDLNSELELDDKNIIVNFLDVNVNDNQLNYSGNIYYLFNKNFQFNTSYKLAGTVKSNSINLDQLLVMNLGNDSSSSNPEFRTKLEIDKIVWGKINLKEFKSDATFTNGILSFENLKCKLCGGLISGKLKITEKDDSTEYSSCLEFKKVDISDLFKVFDNFGQHQLSSENIEGLLAGNLCCTFYFNDKNEFRKKSLRGEANIEVSNGRLQNFQPIYKLSKFVELKELNDIKFSTLKNKITVKNGIVELPYTDINSSALNLNMSGIHSLDNEYEYHFKVLMSDVLFKKAKGKNIKNEEFGELENDTLGRVSLYLKMKGNNHDYTLNYDSKKAVKSFINKLKSEKKTFKTILKEEYGFYKNDSTLDETKASRKKIKVEKESETLKTDNKKKKKHSDVQLEEWKDE